MNFTTYHKLQKPLSTEKYDIGVHNTNADIIDSVLNQLEQNDTSQDNALTNEIKRATERENEIDHKFSTLSKATDQLDGLMSSEDKRRLDEVATGTGQAYKVWKTGKNGNPAWMDEINSSIETPVFDDSTNIYSTLSDAATAAETTSNAIQSNTSIFTTFSNMKKSFSAIVQGLKILAANVGSINGITSDVNEANENTAASIQVVNQLYSNLNKIGETKNNYTTMLASGTALGNSVWQSAGYISLPAGKWIVVGIANMQNLNSELVLYQRIAHQVNASTMYVYQADALMTKATNKQIIAFVNLETTNNIYLQVYSQGTGTTLYMSGLHAIRIK